MPVLNPSMVQFNTGEVTPFLLGRTNYAKYASAAEYMENCLPLIYGPFMKRSGTRYVNKIKYNPGDVPIITNSTILDGTIESFTYQNGSVLPKSETGGHATGLAVPALNLIIDFKSLKDDYDVLLIPRVSDIKLNNIAASDIDRDILNRINSETFILSSIEKIETIVEENTYYLYRLDIASPGRITNSGTIAITAGNISTLSYQDNNNQPTKVLLKAFTFSKDQAYALEIGVGYIRFHTKNGTVINPNTLQPIELATPFTAADLDNLDFAQSNDFLYIASGRHPVQVLKRYSNVSWTIGPMEYHDGPYQDENTNKNIKITPSASAEGSAASLTATGDIFTQGMVGGSIRLRTTATGTSDNDAIGWGTITAVTDARHATCLIEDPFFNTTATYAWRLPEFTTERGYPKKVSIFQGRLVFASTEEKPNTLWLSKSDDYHSFGPTDIHDNEVVDDCAIYLTMAATETNKIQWLSALRQLFVGTLGSEFKIGQINEVMTPKKASSEEVTQYGSSSIKPLKYANELLFVQQAERKIRSMYYDFSTDAYSSQDLSLFAEHLTYSGIAGIVQQTEPYATIWAWLNDGSLRSISYDKPNEVCAWSRQTLGGNHVKVISACCIPFIEENRDQLWLIVERLINGQACRYIETLDRIFDDQVDQKDGYFVDCGGTYKQYYEIHNIALNQTQTAWQLRIVCAKNTNFVVNSIIKLYDIKQLQNSKNNFDKLNGKKFTISNVTHTETETYILINLPNLSEDLKSLLNQVYDAWQGGNVYSCVSAITQGISHLEGEQVYAIVDGATNTLKTVTNGRIELDSPGAVVHIGLPYKAKYKSVRLDIAMNQNDSLASKQRIHKLYAQIYRTNYFKYGYETIDELMPARKYGTDKMDYAPALKTGLIEISFEANWSHEPHILIESDLPIPLCILRLTTQTSINI